MKLLVHRPCSWGLMRPEACTWVSSIRPTMFDAFFADTEIAHFNTNSGCTAIARNNAAKEAIDGGFDLLLMIDPDMQPDIYADEPFAKTFIESSLELLREHPISIVGAPYMLPNAESAVRLFGDSGIDNPHNDTIASRVREPFHEHVPRMGTGLMLINVDVFRRVPEPWFKYVIDDRWQVLNLTEDFYFCSNAAKHGIKTYCNWYAFAGHWHAQCLKAPI